MIRERSADIVRELAGFQAGPIQPLRGLVLRSQDWVAAGASDRRPLPDERDSLTHRFVIHAEDGDYKGYVHVGLYPDGAPGEVFLSLAGPAAGDRLDGLVDGFAIAASLALQNGCPIATLCQKFVAGQFPPAGPTDTPEIPRATSPLDYVARWLRRKFVPEAPSIPLPGVPVGP